MEVARSVDLSVTRAAGEEDFVTAVFAELDPRGWMQLVNCGHPAPLRLSTDGELMPLNPAAFAAPLGLHPDLHASTFSVRTGDRLVFFTDGLLEARDRAGRSFRLDQQIETLRRPDLRAAADELLDRLRAHTRHRLDDDVALLLAELTLTDPASRKSAAAGQRSTAALCPGRPGGDGARTVSRPFRMIAIRWTRRATAESWVTVTSVRPRSRHSCSRSAIISSRACLVVAVKGGRPCDLVAPA
jgi:phosphoserine phosphatase RsbU/P